MKKTLFLLLLVAVYCSSCTPDPGPAGPAGADGQDGNANVVSLTKTLSNFSWQQISDGYAACSISAPEITQDITDKGLVNVYFKTNELSDWGMPTGQWIAMPFSIADADIEFSESFTFSFAPGLLTLYDQTDLAPTLNPGGEIRIVLATADGMTAPVDWKDYQAVQAYFGLKD
jgi:hypothetical protein